MVSKPWQRAAAIQEVEVNDLKSKLSRRHVFAGAGTAGALAAVAAVAAVLPRTPQPVVAAVKPEPVAQEGGYQLTQHVLKYYQTARV